MNITYSKRDALELLLVLDRVLHGGTRSVSRTNLRESREIDGLYYNVNKLYAGLAWSIGLGVGSIPHIAVLIKILNGDIGLKHITVEDGSIVLVKEQHSRDWCLSGPHGNRTRVSRTDLGPTRYRPETNRTELTPRSKE